VIAGIAGGALLLLGVAGGVIVMRALPPEVRGMFQPWFGSLVDTSQQRGDAIISALEAYHADHGQYPSRLGDLVPRYIDRIRRPTAGDRQCRYSVGWDGSDTLSFAASGEYPISWYDAQHHRWRVDD